MGNQIANAKCSPFNRPVAADDDALSDLEDGDGPELVGERIVHQSSTRQESTETRVSKAAIEQVQKDQAAKAVDEAKAAKAAAKKNAEAEGAEAVLKVNKCHTPWLRQPHPNYNCNQLQLTSAETTSPDSASCR